MNVVEIHDLVCSYHGSKKNIVDHLDLTVEAGEIVSIVGSSGCGKSTFLFCLNGLIPHIVPGQVSGKIFVCGKDARKYSVRDLGKNIQIMFQNPETQFFTFNVRDELRFGLENQGLSEKMIADKLEETVDLFKISHLLDRATETLSSGEKQLVILAALTAMLPDILVLDEPTANLDPLQTERLKIILKEINKKYGTAIIIVEHNLDFTEISDRTLLFSDGKLKKYEDELAQYFVSKEKKEKHGETLLEVKNLNYGYEGKKILDGVDFDVREGEVVGLVGFNGSGKSTLIQNIMGLLKPDDGDVIFGGKSIVNCSTGELSRKIGYVFQNPDYTLFENTVADELKFGARNIGMNNEEMARVVEKSLDEFMLAELKNHDPANLSVGQKRRVNIASALAMNPEMLIIDEPNTGLDRVNSVNLARLLNEKNEQGTAILVVSHDIDFLDAICDRFVFLNDGKIVDAQHYFSAIKKYVA